MSDPNAPNSPNMKLPIPNLSDPGPQYATNVSTSLTIIDGHDHDGVNGGVLIDLSEQVCNGDLSVDGYNVSNVRSYECDVSNQKLSGSQDVNCIYVNGAFTIGGVPSLGFNNANGIFIPLTSGNITYPSVASSFTNFQSRNTATTFTILPTDTYILINIDSTNGAIDGYLPVCALVSPTAAGRVFIFRDIGLVAGTNSITLHVANGSGNTFADSGFSNFVLNSNGAYAAFYSDGVGKWYSWNQNVFDHGEEVLFRDDAQLTLTGSFANITNSSGILVESGSSIILDGTSSLEALGTTQFGTSVEFIAGTDTNFDSTSQTTFKSGSTETFNSGSELQLNGKLDGTTTSGRLNIGGSGSIQAANVGAITDGATTGGIQATTSSGIQSTIFGGIQSIVPGGLQHAGGANDWVSFANVRSRTVTYPLQVAGVPSVFYNNQHNNWQTAATGSITGNGDDTFFTTAVGPGTVYAILNGGEPVSSVLLQPNMIALYAGQNGSTQYQQFLLPYLHNGATLSSVNVSFRVVDTVTAYPTTSSAVPQIKVQRVSMMPGSGPPDSSRNALSSSDPQNLPIPVSAAAWYNGGQLQQITYSCNQNNVIDTSQYVYYLQIQDNTYGITAVADNWYAVQLNYTDIVDMRFQ